MLGLRLLFGVPLFFVMIGVFWGDVHYGSGWGTAAMLAAFCVLAVREFYRFARAMGAQPFTALGMGATALLFLAQEYGATHPPAAGLPAYELIVLGLFLAAVLLWQLIGYGSNGTMLNTTTTIAGVLIFWGLLSFVLRMRHLEFAAGHGWEYDGAELVFVFFTGCKICDIAGLLVGKRYGYRKIWPSISPKKSWEGFLGGTVASVGLIAVVLLLHPQSALGTAGWLAALPLGIVLSGLGLLGDLAESAYKREAQMKDAGASMPGFGGVMDMLDSLTLNAPVAYVYLVWVCGARPGI